jgi:hypothetical protein
VARASGGVDYHLKKLFFDRQLVEALIGKKSAKAMGRALAKVRLRAMHSMKPKGKARRRPKRDTGKAFEKWAEEIQNQPVSPAGSPPFLHSNNHVTSLRNIWFGLDNSTVHEIRGVVGALKLNGRQGAIPGLHEHGGQQLIQEQRIGREWIPLGRINKRSSNPKFLRRRMATYPARPFMQPALEKEQDNFPDLWLRAGAA